MANGFECEVLIVVTALASVARRHAVIQSVPLCTPLPSLFLRNMCVYVCAFCGSKFLESRLPKILLLFTPSMKRVVLTTFVKLTQAVQWHLAAIDTP